MNIKYYIIQKRDSSKLRIIYICFDDLLLSINLNNKQCKLEFNTTNLPDTAETISYSKLIRLLIQSKVLK